MNYSFSQLDDMNYSSGSGRTTFWPADAQGDNLHFPFMDEAVRVDQFDIHDIDKSSCKVSSSLLTLLSQQDLQALERSFPTEPIENSITTGATAAPHMPDNRLHEGGVQQSKEQAEIQAGPPITPARTIDASPLQPWSEHAIALIRKEGITLTDESSSSPAKIIDSFSEKRKKLALILPHDDKAEERGEKRRMESFESPPDSSIIYKGSNRPSKRQRSAHLPSMKYFTDEHGEAHFQDTSKSKGHQYDSENSSSNGKKDTSGIIRPAEYLVRSRKFEAGNAVVEIARLRPRRGRTFVQQTATSASVFGASHVRCCPEMTTSKTRDFFIQCDLSTISRRVASWGLPRQQSRTSESPELIEAIRDLVFRVGLTEKQTLAVLQRQGWPITKAGLKRIRLHPDRRWVRRIDSDEERLTLLMKTEQLIIEMTQRSNAISGYGRRFLQPYLRHQKQLWVPRDPLFEMYKIMFPNGVEMRKRMMRRKKGQFLVPGPNYQWCIDGHDKLKAYGFEIYAAIDAYSRIIWFYVGHSATTALSVLKQYLAACDAYRFRPWYLQADRGRETPLVAAAHWNFALAADGRVEWHGQVFEQGKRLRDSYKAGPSTKNIKIESWGSECFTSHQDNG